MFQASKSSSVLLPFRFSPVFILPAFIRALVHAGGNAFEPVFYEINDTLFYVVLRKNHITQFLFFEISWKLNSRARKGHAGFSVAEGCAQPRFNRNEAFSHFFSHKQTEQTFARRWYQFATRVGRCVRDGGIFGVVSEGIGRREGGIK